VFIKDIYSISNRILLSQKYNINSKMFL